MAKEDFAKIYKTSKRFVSGCRHVSAKYPRETGVVLSSAIEFAFRGGTWDKINAFNNVANRIKSNSEMNHNHYSLTSLKQAGKCILINFFFNIES